MPGSILTSTSVRRKERCQGFCSPFHKIIYIFIPQSAYEQKWNRYLFISKSDVEDIMRSRDINYKKTDLKDRPCPTYAVRGYTNDRQHLRVIFAQCKEKTKVATCYDLEKDFEGNCPGDEKKNK